MTMNRNDWNNLINNAPAPQFTLAWQQETALRLRGAFRTDTDVVDGALCWKSNGAVVPPCVFEDAGIPRDVLPAEHLRAYSVALYRITAAHANRRPSAEEILEAGMELGPDAVDVITGRRIGR